MCSVIHPGSQRARGSTYFPGRIQLPAWSLSTHCINQTCRNGHMVFVLPPLVAAACQQLAELAAAGPCLQKAFYFRILRGVETPPLFSALCTI